MFTALSLHCDLPSPSPCTRSCARDAKNIVHTPPPQPAGFGLDFPPHRMARVPLKTFWVNCTQVSLVFFHVSFLAERLAHLLIFGHTSIMWHARTNEASITYNIEHHFQPASGINLSSFSLFYDALWTAEFELIETIEIKVSSII